MRQNFDDLIQGSEDVESSPLRFKSIMRTSPKAALVLLSDGSEVWFPLSTITGINGDSGQIWIAYWFLKRKDLI